MMESRMGRDGGDTKMEVRETRWKPRKAHSEEQCLTPTGEHIGDCHSSLTFSVFLVSIKNHFIAVIREDTECNKREVLKGRGRCCLFGGGDIRNNPGTLRNGPARACAPMPPTLSTI